MRPRVQPSKHYGVTSEELPAHASEAQLRSVSYLPEPLRPVPGTPSSDEDEALALALRDRAGDERGTDALAAFVESHPQSRWAPAIHLNIGSLSYGTGYFQDALSHWRTAWELARTGQDPVSEDIANLALAEYAKMNARIGRTDELEKIFAEAQSRNFMGAARVKMENALEGYWVMRNRPGVAFRCGPYALLNVAGELNPEALKRTTSFLAKAQSPTTGFSLAEVHAMAPELGLQLKMAKRSVGAEVIVPSVIHWKVGHFGAIVREADGRYLVKDPTFGNQTWLRREAIDREASGYFLVPRADLPEGWSKVTRPEASQIYGKGHSGNGDDDDTGDEDDKGPKRCPGGPGGPLAMATYSFHLMLASLHIEDTPAGYSAAVGPDVRVRVAYNQREADQPTTMAFTNFGPQFVSNWISYLVDNPGTSNDVALRKPVGGGETHTGFNTTTQKFGMQVKSAAVLERLTTNTYKKSYPDGRIEYYEQYIGTTGPQRRVFLSRIVDPQGNEVAIDYDATYPSRISQIVDATGLATVFHYDYTGEPYLVTSIEDPFGRESTFTYTTVASKLRLQSIEDPDGIISSFTYNSSGEVAELTTPYGTTVFDLSPMIIGGYADLIRYVQSTDPLGQKERVEYNLSSSKTGVSGTLETPYPSSSVVNYYTGDNDDRNTFVWDKLGMKLAAGNYQRAHRYHWVQPNSADMATSILESEIPPLESRIFYNYPGQTQPYIQGTLAFPSVVARVVKDGTGTNHTQATKYEYNAQGNRTKVIDPVGRETLMEYDTNGVDVLTIKQKTGASTWTTVSSFTYGGGAPAHRPATMTDGAGQTTTYTYTSSGQIATITNAKSEVTTYTYETSTSSPAYGRLLSVTGDVPGGNRSFTYDTSGRVATTTDSEGYTLTYDYDDLDRVRTITYPDSSTEQFEYDDHSLTASKDREGRWTRHMYNPLMERVLTQDPSLRMTQQQWCRCGKLRRFIDGNGNVTEWQRDERARVTKKINADGSYETYAYDFSGRLVTEVDAMSRTLTTSYTLDDRISKKDYSDTSTPDVTYAYDAWFPRLTSRVDGTGTTTFAYHAFGGLGAGKLSLVNGPLTDDTLKHTYDELGRLKKLEIVDDATQSTATYSEEYTFDARARVTTVANNLGSSTYAFSGQSSRPTTVTYPNGMQILYDYFGASGDFLLKQIKNLSSGTTPTVISQFDYTYRQDRSIDTWTVAQGSGTTSWTFGYDPTKQLTSAQHFDGTTLLEALYYGYDKAGNRVQVGSGTTSPKNYEVNSLNQLTKERDHGPTTFSGTVDEPATVKVNGKTAKVLSTDGGAPYRFEALVDLDAGSGTVTVEAKDGQNNTATKTYAVTTTGESKKFEYDANGNLRYEKLPDDTVVREYRWDQQNRLVRALIGTHESVYEYDGESRRVRIKELESSSETKNETFVWCDERICQKRSGWTVVRNYFDQGFEEGTSDYFYTRDHLGSVREVVGSDGTTIASRVSYDPWGKITETGSGALTDFAFTGHHYDRPTALSLAWWRGYDAGLGRWISKDPIGLRGGLNLYGYVNNDPVRLMDPTGELPWGPPNPPPKPPTPPCSPLKQCPYSHSEFVGNPDRTICHYKCGDGTSCSITYMGYVTCPGWGECGKPN